jgi:hypothetical protein
VPSNWYTVAPYPPQRSRARRTIRSNTGCGITRRGGHHLQHVVGSGLIRNPLAVSAVHRQFGTGLVELALEFRNSLWIRCRIVRRRGHLPNSSRPSVGGTEVSQKRQIAPMVSYYIWSETAMQCTAANLVASVV